MVPFSINFAWLFLGCAIIDLAFGNGLALLRALFGPLWYQRSNSVANLVPNVVLFHVKWMKFRYQHIYLIVLSIWKSSYFCNDRNHSLDSRENKIGTWIILKYTFRLIVLPVALYWILIIQFSSCNKTLSDHHKKNFIT